MKKQSLLVLAVVTLAIVAAATWAVQTRSTGSAAKETDARLFPALVDKVNDVAEIEIRKGTDTVTVRQTDQRWTLAERDGYPAKFDRVKETVVGIAELEIDERKTSRPENYEQLGVGEPAEDSQAARAILRDGSGNVLADVILGEVKYRGGTQMLFVRKADDPQVYQCEGRVRVDAMPTSWIDREILKVDADRVRAVTVRHPDGETVRIERAVRGEPTFVVRDVPPGRVERSRGIANSVATTLSYLSLDDVRSADSVDFTAEPLATAEFERYDGLIVTLETARFEERPWARISARYEPPAESPPTPADDTAEAPADDPADTQAGPTPEDALAEDGAAPAAEGASASAARDAAAAAEAARADTDRINATLVPWAFQLPQFKADALNKHLADLVMDEPVGPSPAADETTTDDMTDEPTTDENGLTQPEATEDAAGDEGEEGATDAADERPSNPDEGETDDDEAVEDGTDDGGQDEATEPPANDD